MPSTLVKLRNYFDLQQDPLKYPYLGLFAAGIRANRPTVLVQIVFFVAVVLGVAVSPFLAATISSGKPQWPLPAPVCGWWAWLFYAPLIAAVLFPWVYKFAADRRKVVAIQVCLFFAYGVAWNLVTTAALKLIVASVRG